MEAEALRQLALSLPEAQEIETWGDATFRVRHRIFVIMGADGTRVTVKATREEQRAVIQENPTTYYLPDYVAQHGWIGIHLGKAPTDEVTELVTEAWRMTAPRRVVAAFDAERG